MRNSGRPLEWQANLCGLVVGEIALDLELAGEDRAVRFPDVGLRPLDGLAALVDLWFIVHSQLFSPLG